MAETIQKKIYSLQDVITSRDIYACLTRQCKTIFYAHYKDMPVGKEGPGLACLKSQSLSTPKEEAWRILKQMLH